jgi:Glycosyl transferase family 2
VSNGPSAPRPSLSVVVLNYNYARYLPECLSSILGQTFTDFELVVIDDCSKDDSVQVVEKFLTDPRLRLHKNPKNLGFAGSLILGTEGLTNGEFVTVISADDTVRSSRAFEKQVALLRAHPAAAFCFSAIDFLQGATHSGSHHSFPDETVLESNAALHALLTFGNVWPLHSGTLIRRTAYDAAGGYRRDLKMVLDLGIWLPLAMQGGFAYSPETLYGYRVHEGQMSVALAGIRRNARELRTVLRAACAEGERRGFHTAALARQALGLHLANTAIVDAFSGNRKVAAQRYLAAALECPLETLTSKKLWVIALRIALGEKLTVDAQRVAQRLRVGRTVTQGAGAGAGARGPDDA